jgi:hypothetical protein
MNATIKKITLSLIQFDTAIENGDYEGIKKFINEFEPLYEKLLIDYKYSESEFKKEVQDIFDYLFSDEKIIDYAFGKFKNEYGAIPIDSKLTPSYKKIYEIKSKHTPFDWSVVEKFRPDPIKEFAFKYHSIYINYKTKPTVELIDTLEKACLGSSEYKSIKAWFIKKNLCDPVSLDWLDKKRGNKSILVNYLIDLYNKGYTKSLMQPEIVLIAKNSFNFSLKIDIVKRPKANDPRLPEIPHFKI